MALIAVRLHTHGPRATCCICHNLSDKGATVGVLQDPHGFYVIICRECLEAGPEAVPARFEESAQHLEQQAAELRAAKTEEWQFPSPGAIVAAEDQEEAHQRDCEKAPPWRR